MATTIRDTSDPVVLVRTINQVIHELEQKVIALERRIRELEAKH